MTECNESCVGAISSNGLNADGLQSEFSLTLFQDGLLPAAFMIGLLASSPIFAEAAKRSGSFRLIGHGLSIWSIAVACCSISIGFISLLVCRMAVGVGEASFVALAAPFIDDFAPKDHKVSWLALFFLCIPVGYALGFLYGGIVAVAVGWRLAFLIESLLMVPFIIFHFRARGVKLRTECSSEDSSTDISVLDKFMSTMNDVKELFAYKVFVLTTLGMTCYTAVIGSYAFYGPQAGKETFHVEPETADFSFGAMTVVTGILGTLAGGLALDRAGSSLKNGMILCCIGMVLGAVVIVVAFLASPSFAVFCNVFAVGELLLFFTQAPSNALILWSVPPASRPLAISLSVISMHLLGDVPSPPIIGIIQSCTQNWRYTMSMAGIILGLGGLCYGAGIKVAVSSRDYRDDIQNEDTDEQEAILPACG